MTTHHHDGIDMFILKVAAQCVDTVPEADAKVGYPANQYCKGYRYGAALCSTLTGDMHVAGYGARKKERLCVRVWGGGQGGRLRAPVDQN